MLGCELVNGVIKDQHFVALLFILLEDGALENGIFGVASQVQNRILVVLHAGNIFVERGKLVWVVSRLEPRKKLVQLNCERIREL